MAPSSLAAGRPPSLADDSGAPESVAAPEELPALRHELASEREEKNEWRVRCLRAEAEVRALKSRTRHTDPDARSPKGHTSGVGLLPGAPSVFPDSARPSFGSRCSSAAASPR